MQLLGGALPVVPRMAEEDVPKVWQGARLSTLSRTGVSARTSAGVYTKDEPARDHLGLALLPDPPPLLRPTPLPPDDE